ncbi:MAG: fibronectin type III domain-containing protein [Thaumarchaeota archaeon]|nr:fibronectin type III domain-containing protein [Nitrososphaerota archaeon]
MNKDFAIPLTVLVSLILAFSMLAPAAYAEGSGKWSAKPYFEIQGNATDSPKGTTPVQIWQAYGFNKMTCTMTSPVGWDYVNLCGHDQTIAIVDPYDDPTIESDLAAFGSQWGLPECTSDNGCLVKLFPSGSAPDTNSTWAMEESLDVEWAHATSPGAKILLVESNSSSFWSLVHAINYTETNTDAKQFSIGWGVTEFPNETKYDSYFAKPGITFFAPSGNGVSHLYPSASPDVVSVGGTTLGNVSNATRSETVWSGSSGGESSYEQEPIYQIIFGINSDDKRAVPDVAYDADPKTGFPVYDSTPYNNQTGWFLIGGTSAGVPQWASIAAIANSQGAALSTYKSGAMSNLYTAATGSLFTSNYHDINQGGAGINQATPGFDFTSGLGSPIANSFVSFLSPKPTSPSIPLNLTAAPSNQHLSLSWLAPSFTGGSKITKYNIYRGTDFGGEMYLTTLPPTNESYVDPWLENGVTYYYYVTAVNSVGESHNSNEAYATPGTISSAPQTLSAYLTNGQVYLTWQPPAATNGSPIKQYNVYRGTSAGKETLLTSITDGTTSYADAAVGASPSYYYYVTAVNSVGESIPSNEISVTEPPATSQPPQDLTIITAKNQVLLSWKVPFYDGGSPIVKYNIYAGSNSGGEIFLTSVSDKAFQYTNYPLVNGITYYYYVTAINAIGESKQSNEVYGTPR